MGLAFISTASMAQLSQFTGWEAGATLAINDTKIRIDSDSTSGNSTGFGLHAGYGLEKSNDMVYLFGIDYNFNSITAGDITNGAGTVYTRNLKNPFGLSFGMGYLVNDNTLAFGKLSYEAATYSLDTYNQDVSGLGLAGGARYMLNKNTYLQAELKYTTYTHANGRTITNADLNNTQVNISVGVNF